MKKILTLIFMTVLAVSSVYAQILSAGTGQWSSPATWVGGVVPTASDNVSIETGHTVTVSNDLAAISISDASQTTTVVTITTAAAHGLIVGQPVIITGSSASGINGTYYIATVPTTTTFTYTKTSATIASTGASGSIAPQRNLSGTLTLNGGNLAIGTGAILTMSGASANIVRASATGTLTVSGSPAGVFSVAQRTGDVTTLTINANCTAGTEASNAASGKNHLVVSSGMTYTLTATTRQVDNLTLNGTLGGSFTINVKGNVSGTGSSVGTIALRFGSGSTSTIDGVSFNNFTLNTSATTYVLAAPITVNGTLTLTQGHISLSTHDLTIASTGSITMTTPTIAKSFIVTNSTGKLIMPVAAGVAKVFPIGSSSTAAATLTPDYSPVTITAANSVTFAVKVSQSLTPAFNVPTKAVARVWDLAPTAAAGDATLVFAVPKTTLVNANNSVGNAVYGHYIGGSWKERIATFSDSTWTVSAHPGSEGFSPFGVGVETAFNATVLPVELTNFQAKASSKATLLTWSTASEKNNALFNVEQSTNGVDFQAIGQVKGKGTTNATSTYNFEHSTPSVGVNYYRLQQVDVDGKTTFSAVKSIVFGKTGLILKNTLAVATLDVVVSEDNATPLSIFNISGQQIMTVKAQGTQRLDVSALQSGVYFVRTATGDVARFVKQ